MIAAVQMMVYISQNGLKSANDIVNVTQVACGTDNASMRRISMMT
jgi:hypothetical protein